MIVERSCYYGSLEKRVFVSELWEHYSWIFKNKKFRKKAQRAKNHIEMAENMIRQFELWELYKSGLISVRFERNFTKNISGEVLFSYENKKIKMASVIIYVQNIEQSQFVLAHELSHIRMKIDNHKFFEYEVSTDILALIAGYAKSFLLGSELISILKNEILSLPDSAKSHHYGYIDKSDFWILDEIQKKQKKLWP